MKELQKLSKSDLLTTAKDAVAKEREATLFLIEVLREVNSRMLYAELGYSSLWEFATQYLGLSAGAAHRRIAALKLSQEIPAVKEALEEGRLKLSTAAQMQSFFQQEKKNGKVYTRHEKLDLLQEVQCLSTRECEKKLFALSPESIPQEKVRPVSEFQTELRVVLDQETLDKLQKLKELQFPDATYAELIRYLADLGIQAAEKKKGISGSTQAPTPAPEVKKSPEPGIRLYVSKIDKRKLYQRSGGQCEYVSPDGKRCFSRYRIQIDHIQALALGGLSEFSNYRHLCWTHNRQQAREQLGDLVQN